MAFKHSQRKTPPQLRVKANDRLLDHFEATALRYGYGKVGPFVRRLMDAARQGDPRTGALNFYVGKDVLAEDVGRSGRRAA